ncbi:uncharacterized protein LOC143152792 [Ptiloglossa arizonensis]|uniref:uncharacterized protein LOC143152792 n=1 Tax=Ptiloglossa arizonensis TaxID=3350558 RepID=UPI003FA10F6D
MYNCVELPDQLPASRETLIACNTTRATKFSHVYACQCIRRTFLYEAHATGKKLHLFGENWPDSFFPTNSRHRSPFQLISLRSNDSNAPSFFRSFYVLPVFARKLQTKLPNISRQR